MTALRVLILEDRPTDAELLLHELRRAGFDVEWTRVQDAADFAAALDPGLDVILADYKLPNFDPLQALRLVRERGLDIPFIVVSGTLGDEVAAACIKEGATDYLLKDRLGRLGQAVTRAVGETRLRVERRRTDEALRESQRRLELAMRASHIGPWDWDLVTNAVHFSPEWKRQLGHADDEISNDFREWESRLHPEDHDRTLAAALAYVADPSRGYDVEFRLRHADGSYRWIHTRGSLVLDAAGKPVRMLGCHVDVTERKAKEEEYDRLAKAMQLLLDSTGEGIYGVDLEGRCTFINRAGAVALAARQRDLLGADLHERTHHHRADGAPYPAQDCPILHTCRTGTPARVDGELFWRQDGSSFPVGYSCYPVVQDGVVQGAVVTFADVTEKRKLEERLLQSQKLEALGELTGGIAHDFNNLLTTVLCNAEFLLDELSKEDPRRGEVEAIRKAGESAAALTRQLLAFSRQQVLEPMVLDLNEVVASVEKLLRRVLGEDLTLTTTLARGLHPILADRTQVEQVLLNLALNARDAMPDGGALTIRTVAGVADHRSGDPGPGGSPEHVVLEVSDTGCGMSDEVKARIFEPFFTTKEPGRGTGLGLATVFGIVEQSGGTIEVESAVGRGSTFRIRLPCTATAAQGSRPAAPLASPRRGSESVLLVEDEPALRALAQAGLERAGYRVHAAANAEEAMALGSRDVDILVTDLVLTGIDGHQLARSMTSLLPALKVLYISGHTGSTLLHRKGLGPGEAFLAKPFTPRQLVAKVRDVLDSSRDDDHGAGGASSAHSAPQG